ncbi:hypothetical protein V8F06_013542 [Rhypophila decipiens]
MPLRPRVSPIAHRTIRQAFDDLERTISEKDKISFASTTLENVVQAAHAIEDELAARQLLRNMRRLAPLFNGLGYYSKSIEVVCNGTPYLPWIWAPIKLVLKVASDYIEAFEKLIVAYARIAEPLARFNLLHQTHFDNLEIQQALAMFYSDILRFHKEAYKFVRRGGWKVLFMTSWGRFQRRFDSIIDDLKAHEGLVDKTVNAVGSCDIRKTREEVEALRMERLERVAKEDEDRTAAQYIAIVGWLKMDDAEQAKILDTVLVEPRKFSETCDWMLRQDRIAAWMRCSQESPFLVLHGRPGTGKSVLMAQITEFLRSAGKSLVISHISTYAQPSSTEYDQILRSILLQLVRSETDLIAYIYDEFILRKKAVTAQAIERIILEAVRAICNNPATTTYVHILFDGLDECDKGKQLKIVTLLERIASCAFESPTTVCKVLISCRMIAPTSQRLRQKHCVSLSTEKVAVEKSIGFYASQRLSQLRLRWSQLGITDSELKELELRLAAKADGMFLWAKLVLNYLATNMFLRKSEVIEAVDVLPRELSDFYGRILTQLLANFDNRSVTRLQSILGWIAFAKRPLRRAELRFALAFTCEESEVHVQGLAPNYIFDFCAPLVEEHPDSTFAFVHISVKEFLQSPQGNHLLDEARAVHDQGLAVASCLLSGYQVFQPSYPEDMRFLRVLRGFHGLHLYASEYWAEYILSVAMPDRGLDAGSLFFFRSQQLVSALDCKTSSNDIITDPKLLDGRLCNIEQYHELWNMVATTLAEKTIKGFTVPQENGETALGEITSLSSLQSNYQRTIKALLQLTQFPGIRSQDLEIFKREVRSIALTCRIVSCSLAGIYFENEAQRDKHELTHAPRIMCDVSGCGYPPLSSVAALRNHKINQHNIGSMYKMRIRKPEPPEPTRRMKISPGINTRAPPRQPKGNAPTSNKRPSFGIGASFDPEYSKLIQDVIQAEHFRVQEQIKDDIIGPSRKSLTPSPQEEEGTIAEVTYRSSLELLEHGNKKRLLIHGQEQAQLVEGSRSNTQEKGTTGVETSKSMGEESLNVEGRSQSESPEKNVPESRNTGLPKWPDKDGLHVRPDGEILGDFDFDLDAHYIFDPDDYDFDLFLRGDDVDKTMENWSPGPPTNSVHPSSRPTDSDTEPTPRSPIPSPGSKIQEHRSLLSSLASNGEQSRNSGGPVTVINHGSYTDMNINYQNLLTEIHNKDDHSGDHQERLMFVERQRKRNAAKGQKKAIEDELRELQRLKMDLRKQIASNEAMASASSNANSIPVAGISLSSHDMQARKDGKHGKKVDIMEQESQPPTNQPVTGLARNDSVFANAKRIPRIPEEAWELFKSEILEYYETHTLEEVIQYMKEHHDFTATKRQYIHRILKKWRIQKFNKKSSQIQFKFPASIEH